MPYTSYKIQPPWFGIASELTDVYSPPGAFKNVINFFTVRGRLQTRPKLVSYSPVATAPDGNKIYFLRSFRDVNGNLHTVALTIANAYYITSGLTFTLITFPAGISALGSVDRPFGIAVILNRIYLSNGSTKILVIDGSAAMKVAGDVPGGARFLAVIGSILVLGYLHENSRTYGNAVRWSVVGNPNSYNGFGAGHNVLIEVPDEITGIVGATRSGFIFRSNGITLVTPTGIGIAPLSFEHFSTEPEGVGNRYPYTLSSYGNRSFFVSDDDVYALDFPTFTPVGGLARRKIFEDIALANAPIVGRVVPGLGVGYEFLSYWLTIPKASATVSWVYAINEQSWVRFEGNGALTAIAQVFTT
jgi:hypothetical protein